MSNSECFFVYILYAPSFDKYYIGQTADIKQRLLDHNHSEKNNFTSRYRPWNLMLSIPVPSRNIALRMERYIKNRKSKSYWNNLIHKEEIRTKLLNKFNVIG